MRKLLLFGILLLLFVTEINSQDSDSAPSSKNGVYLEAYLWRHDFSNGFVSVNYERVVGKKQRANFRIGVYPDFESTISIPITLTWITNPSGIHHFEYGFGAVFRIEHYVDPYGLNSKEWFYDMPAIMVPLMYRYQKKDGFFLRTGVNLFVSWPTIPSPALCLGYRF